MPLTDSQVLKVHVLIKNARPPAASPMGRQLAAAGVAAGAAARDAAAAVPDAGMAGLRPGSIPPVAAHQQAPRRREAAVILPRLLLPKSHRIHRRCWGCMR